VYNYAPQLKAGTPEDRRRCCYIFPLLTPAGVSMLDDFPADHLHHRGLFWAWPVVETAGKQYDGWMTLTAREHSARLPVVGTAETQARLQASNLWQADGRDIVRETLRLAVFPSRNGSREVEADLAWETLGAPVMLRGSREQGKSYGGFCARFTDRTGTALRADGQTLANDEDLNPHRWAELEGVYNGKRAALRITAEQPLQWCLRKYGFVGASFPGRTGSEDGYTLEPGKPLKLRFRVEVRDVP
jgi:hypothetical protein